MDTPSNSQKRFPAKLDRELWSVGRLRAPDKNSIINNGNSDPRKSHYPSADRFKTLQTLSDSKKSITSQRQEN